MNRKTSISLLLLLLLLVAVLGLGGCGGGSQWDAQQVELDGRSLVFPDGSTMEIFVDARIPPTQGCDFAPLLLEDSEITTATPARGQEEDLSKTELWITAEYENCS
jgi:hypothetical protein